MRAAGLDGSQGTVSGCRGRGPCSSRGHRGARQAAGLLLAEPWAARAAAAPQHSQLRRHLHGLGVAVAAQGRRQVDACARAPHHVAHCGAAGTAGGGRQAAAGGALLQGHDEAGGAAAGQSVGTRRLRNGLCEGGSGDDGSEIRGGRAAAVLGANRHSGGGGQVRRRQQRRACRSRVRKARRRMHIRFLTQIGLWDAPGPYMHAPKSGGGSPHLSGGERSDEQRDKQHKTCARSHHCKG